MRVRLRKFEREPWFPTFSTNLCGNAYWVPNLKFAAIAPHWFSAAKRFLNKYHIKLKKKISLSLFLLKQKNFKTTVSERSKYPN